MRNYVSGDWGFGVVWGLKASVFPRAFAMASSNAMLCYLISRFIAEIEEWDTEALYEIRRDEADSAIKILAGFTSVQFMLLSFRSVVAYNRWWEGGTLLQKTRGEWFNAYSSLIAFSSTLPEMASRVEEFHHLLARLMSLLFCAGLQQVSPNQNRAFEIIDTRGIDPISLDFLSESPDKAEVLLQWIQRSTVLNMHTGVLTIAPPILSRAFQEISRGIVNLQNARKIADFPFPFPYAQVSLAMLMVHYVTCPIAASLVIENEYMAALASFLVVFVLWCINFIALQLEYPFGERDNDLPMLQFQKDWNKSLSTLLGKRSQNPPIFHYDETHHRKLGLIMSDGSPICKDIEGVYSTATDIDKRQSRMSKTVSAVSKTVSHTSKGTRSSTGTGYGKRSKDLKARPSSVRNFRGSTIDAPDSQVLDSVATKGQRDSDLNRRPQANATHDDVRRDPISGDGRGSPSATRGQRVSLSPSIDTGDQSRETGRSDEFTYVYASGVESVGTNDIGHDLQGVMGEKSPLPSTTSGTVGTLNAGAMHGNSRIASSHPHHRKPVGERIPALFHGDPDIIGDGIQDDFNNDNPSRTDDATSNQARQKPPLLRSASNISEAHRQAALRSRETKETRSHSALSDQSALSAGFSAESL